MGRRRTKCFIAHGPQVDPKFRLVFPGLASADGIHPQLSIGGAQLGLVFGADGIFRSMNCSTCTAVSEKYPTVASMADGRGNRPRQKATVENQGFPGNPSLPASPGVPRPIRLRRY